MASVLSLDEAADFLGVHPKTVRRMVDRSEIRGYHLGKLLRFKQEDLDRALVPVEALVPAGASAPAGTETPIAAGNYDIHDFIEELTSEGATP